MASNNLEELIEEFERGGWTCEIQDFIRRAYNSGVTSGLGQNGHITHDPPLVKEDEVNLIRQAEREKLKQMIEEEIKDYKSMPLYGATSVDQFNTISAEIQALQDLLTKLEE